MKRIVAILLLASLCACATKPKEPPEDRDCRRASQILNDDTYYDVCLIQKGLK